MEAGNYITAIHRASPPEMMADLETEPSRGIDRRSRRSITTEGCTICSSDFSHSGAHASGIVVHLRSLQLLHTLSCSSTAPAVRPSELGRLDEGDALLDVDDELGHRSVDEGLLPVGQLAERVDLRDAVRLRIPSAPPPQCTREQTKYQRTPSSTGAEK